jgi:hypothetical protein
MQIKGLLNVNIQRLSNMHVSIVMEGISAARSMWKDVSPFGKKIVYNNSVLHAKPGKKIALS